MIVADANIIVYRFIPSSRTEDAISLVNFDAEWAAPILWRSEVRNALSNHMRAGQINRQDAKTMMQLATACLLGGEHAV